MSRRNSRSGQAPLAVPWGNDENQSTKRHEQQKIRTPWALHEQSSVCCDYLLHYYYNLLNQILQILEDDDEEFERQRAAMNYEVQNPWDVPQGDDLDKEFERELAAMVIIYNNFIIWLFLSIANSNKKQFVTFLFFFYNETSQFVLLFH